MIKDLIILAEKVVSASGISPDIKEDAKKILAKYRRVTFLLKKKDASEDVEQYIRERIELVAKQVFAILKTYPKYSTVEYKALFTKNRKRELVECRQIIMSIAYKVLYPEFFSETNIGKFFDKDHSTVSHAIKTVRDIKELREIYDYIIKKITKRALKVA